MDIYLKRTIVFAALLTFATDQYASFASGKGYNYKTERYLQKNRDVNQCLHRISTQNDVTGVFLESKIMACGAFSIMHQNVPILFLTAKEFVEYSPSRLAFTHRPCVLCSDWPRSRAGFHSLNTAADVIHEQNARYLFKKIVESRHYNYAVVSANKTFFYPGFIKILETPSVALWKRTFNPEAETVMARKAAGIPQYGTSMEGLVYEAEVLKQLGNYKAAIARFREALSRGHDRASIFSSLAFCLQRDGDNKHMVEVMQTCYRKYKQAECHGGGKAYILDRPV